MSAETFLHNLYKAFMIERRMPDKLKRVVWQIKFFVTLKAFRFKRMLRTVVELYNLGHIRSAKFLSYSTWNYVFLVETEHNTFVVSFQNIQMMNDSNHHFHERLFALLNYLHHSEDFPYQTPLPIKNQDSEYTAQLHGYQIRVNTLIRGDTVVNVNDLYIQELGRALASYHHVIARFPSVENPNREFQKRIKYDYDGSFQVESIIERLRALQIGTQLFQKIQPFLIARLRQVQGVTFHEHPLFVHHDFGFQNVLFRENRLVGIYDFENVHFVPRIFDIVNAMILGDFYTFPKGYAFLQKLSLFLTAYHELCPLSEREKEFLIPVFLIKYAKTIVDPPLTSHTQIRMRMIHDIMKNQQNIENFLVEL